jgi:two-component system, OmpR family, response regulator QseB
MRVLLVEDDQVLCDGVRVGLGMQGATVDAVSTLADAYCALSNNSFDAIVLGVMLPDGSGIDWLRAVRASGDRTPTLVLTALDETPDRIAGLDAGADDYLGKPFDLDELAARVRAIVRRAAGRAEGSITWGDVVLDPARLGVSKAGSPVSVSRREFAILAALMERPGVIQSKPELIKLYR